ncbi:hypothetical protein Vlu01_43260 [Micromonospora lutea]|uniref:Uncharacterized protein n=1 Tax=Micromonospora lutea TaxID=419825 RepID=A0ABQ4J0R9_9ACTN|nr:hypothetical protein Vlu01_43260 [Micromonospora lutea]
MSWHGYVHRGETDTSVAGDRSRAGCCGGRAARPIPGTGPTAHRTAARDSAARRISGGGDACRVRDRGGTRLAPFLDRPVMGEAGIDARAAAHPPAPPVDTRWRRCHQR